MRKWGMRSGWPGRGALGASAIVVAGISGLTANPTYGTTAQIGVVLTATLTNATPTGYQWKKVVGGNILGATGSTYTPVAGDDLADIYCTVTHAAGSADSPSYRVRYAAPTFSVQPTIGAGNIGDTITFTEGTAGPNATLTVEELTLAGVDKTGELVGLDWDTTGESAGTIAWQIRATNSGGTVLSNRITRELEAAPSVATIAITSSGPQAGDGDVPLSYTIDQDDSTVECVIFAASEPNPVAADFNGGGAPTYVDQGTVALTVSGSPIALSVVGTWDDVSVKLALLPTGGGDGDVVVSTAFNLDTAPPGVSSLSPADNGTDIAIDAPLVMTFSDGMKRQGTVTLKNVGGATIETFDLSAGGTWSTTTEVDDTWTGVPASDFTGGAALAVQWSGLEDSAGNALPDNATDTTWNFDVVSGPPDITSAVAVFLDPSDLSTMKQEITGASATTAVAVGDLVGSIQNLGTAGGWFTAPTTGQRPTLRQTGGGEYYLEFRGNGGGAGHFLRYTGGSFDMTGGFSVCMAFEQISSNANFERYWQVANGGNDGANKIDGLVLLELSGTNHYYTQGHWNGSGYSNISTGGTGLAPLRVLEMHETTTSAELLNNGSSLASVGSLAARTGGPSSDLTIGGAWDGSQFWSSSDIDVYGFVAEFSALSAGDKTDVRTVLAALAGV